MTPPKRSLFLSRRTRIQWRWRWRGEEGLG